MDSTKVVASAFDYWTQVDDMVEGDYKYSVINYAMPRSKGAFIEEYTKSDWMDIISKTKMGETLPQGFE